MARIRQIKPEFWNDDVMCGIPPITRLFYIGLWNHADDDGLLEDKPGDLKRRIMASDKFDAAKAIELLVRLDRLERWQAVDGAMLLKIVNFHVHQIIGRPSKPKLLTRLGYARGEKIDVWVPIIGTLNEYSMSPHDSPLITSAVGVRVGVEVEVKKEPLSDSPKTNTDDAVLLDVFEHWKTAAKKTAGALLTDKRRRKIEKALVTFSPDDVKRAITYQAENAYRNEAGKVFNDIELFLRDDTRISAALEAIHDAGISSVFDGRGPRDVATRATTNVDTWALTGGQS